ncbi:MAG: Cu(I)-responsive transcriptional regulator [Gammaproteobacteria bacterium]|nr:Cu(I)-responsive transcriptional regulator [Gammaproteobacteria bacterium]
MNIKQAARLSGIPSKTLRYYEDIKLLVPRRLANGYRDYTGDDVQRARFLARARNLGFSIDNCRSLLALWDDRTRASADVKAIASGHLREVETKLRELETMREVLRSLVDACGGDQSPECPILRDLAGEQYSHQAAASGS